MNKTLLRISLAGTMLLACSQLGLAVPQNGWAASNGAEPSIAEAASSYPDAPSAVKTSGAPDKGSKQARSRTSEPAMRGGVSRALDGKYVVVMSTMFASSIVNVEKTNKCLEERTCSFVPVVFRSRGALYGVGISAEVGVAYLSYKLKEHGHRWWFVPAMVVTAANTYVAYRFSQR
jgi:hypothetical protein